jgi:class 3 adenylate cyclase
VLESVEATLACQQALVREAWTDLPHPLRVRIGLHTGEAQFRDGDYFGSTTHRAARLMSKVLTAFQAWVNGERSGF